MHVHCDACSIPVSHTFHPRLVYVCLYTCVVHVGMHVACTWDAYCVHVGCMLRARGMHVACTWDACCVHVGCMLRARGMHVACTWDACCVHVGCMLRARGMHVACT